MTSMYMAELGAVVRKARKGRGLTQAALARRAGLSRETLNQLEGGMAKELGLAKILRLLRALNLDLLPAQNAARSETDYVQLAAAAGSTGFREALGEDELVHALMSGKAPPRRRPHLRRLLEDSPPTLVQGLVTQVSQWSTPAKVQRNLAALAKALDVELRPEWTTPA